MAKSTWALFDEERVEHLMANNCGNAKEWLFFLLETLSHEDFVRVTVTIWAIWTARRKAIHELIYQSPLSIFCFINSFLADLRLAHEVQKERGPSRQRPQLAKWVAPPPGMCKVSVDAALSKTTIAGAVGAICRDEHGVFMGASARVIDGINDPMTLEAYACSEGLALAEDLHIDSILVATDCLVVSREINDGSLASYGSILKEIAERRRHFNDSRVIHEGRSSNIEAHNFAKSSVALQIGRHLCLGVSPDPIFVPINIID
jgi:hypothetical protein